IRNASDLLVVLEAVRRGILPLISHRLSASNRDQLRNGFVFVWEESQSEGGMARWTDGRRWSKSKVFADCLLYEEKVEITEEEREAKAMRRAQRTWNPGTNILSPQRNQRPSKHGGLTKQTYTFCVRVPGSFECRKWHTVVYTLWSERASLPVIEDYPELRDIRVPVGVFARLGGKSSDAVTMRLSADQVSVDREEGWGAMCATASSRRPLRTARDPPSEDAVVTLRPTLPSFCPGKDGGAGTVLPPVSWLKPLHRGQSPLSPYHWDTVCQEDRRMLNSFQLRL
ncbi:Gti1/Pac2 family-domain-containing protein, partial [Mycena latifolia]